MPGFCSPWSLRFRFIYCVVVLPKSLFRRFPFRALARLAGVLEFTSILFSPLLELGARLGKLLLPGHAGKRGRLFAAREELKQITTESEREGGLTATERAMIHSVVDFRGSKSATSCCPLRKLSRYMPARQYRKRSSLAPLQVLIVCLVLAPDGQPAGLVNIPGHPARTRRKQTAGRISTAHCNNHGR